MISARSPVFFTRIPVSRPGLLREKPLIVTFTAWMVIMPNTVDSPTPKARTPTELPACAPLRVRLGTPIDTSSIYAPAQTSITSPLLEAATAAPMVLYAANGPQPVPGGDEAAR